jgi:hypothetical protein
VNRSQSRRRPLPGSGPHARGGEPAALDGVTNIGIVVPTRVGVKLTADC